MMDPYNFNDEEFDCEGDDYPYMQPGGITQGERLKRFKDLFDSSSRAMLQDCLFRIVDHEDGKGTLEILCPNQYVLNRLSKKKRKIVNAINTCWDHIEYFSLCIEYSGGLFCQQYGCSRTW